jgi:aryl-phospho-beta-D-glucosidase BglC (GH1 family)
MMKWVGFNFQWMYSWSEGRRPLEPDLKALDFMAKHGFNFARFACDYRFWTKDFNYFHCHESAFEYLDRYLIACQERGIHMSLNMHRVPGYCINRPDLEKHNLWTDKEAQDGFTHQWKTLTKRYAHVTSHELSFDLVNEPPEVGELGLTRENHASLIRKVFRAIREIDPYRLVVIDGLGGGHIAMPELADLDVTHSGRGYQPMSVSHYGATWWEGWKGHEPVYPGGDWLGHEWNKDVLRDFYKPWLDVQHKGRPIHIGEFGCYNQTPNDVALRWFKDLVGLYREFNWGWSLWNFEGPLGIIEHGRPGAVYEPLDGFKVDVELFDILRP